MSKTATFKVGKYTCEMSYHSDGDLYAVWSPDLPRQLSKRELRQYRAGRNAFLIEEARTLGGAIAVIE